MNEDGNDDDRKDGSRILSRRRALQTSGGLAIAVAPWLLGCKTAPAPAPSAPDGSPGAPMPRATSSSAGVCALTHDNIEGPYYRAGAPDRWDLVDAGMPGVPLEIEGRVTTADCKHGIASVELDVWQANASGQYDNDGSIRAGERFLLRGRLRTDGDGRYRVRTIVPGRYLNGRQYRPSHVHVKLSANGVAPLTTQLYFPDDPYNRVDPFIHESLVMDVKKVDAGLRARFDFVLAARV